MNDPTSHIEEFHRLLAQDPIETDDTFDDTDLDDDTDLTDALATVGLEHLSPEAQDMVLNLTHASTSIDPNVRVKLMDAAARALRTRRDATSPLPRLLFTIRRDTGEELEDVADAVGMPADQFKQVERGDIDVNTLVPATVADWICHFRIPIEQAHESLKNTFVVPELHDIAAAVHAQSLADTDRFIEDVLDCMRRRPTD